MRLRCLQAIALVIDQGVHFDLIIMDERFEKSKLTGSQAIPYLRAALSGTEVIIRWSGYYSLSTLPYSTSGADAEWGKPSPDWRDGTMQKHLIALFARRRMSPSTSN